MFKEPNLLTLSDLQLEEILSCVLSIVLSPLYKKKEIIDATADQSVNFKIVRDTMYKYSRKVQEKFFSSPTFAFMFLKWTDDPLILKNLEEKQVEQDEKTGRRLMSEISNMREDAFNLLKI